MKNVLFTISALLIFNYCLSQNHWYFGHYAGVSFSNGQVNAVTNGQLSTQEGVASISDDNGNLLFYTDGVTIWDRTHTAMPNATGDLLGHWSSTQSAKIVPNPANANQYYVFTVDELGGSNGLRYSLVDVSLMGNGTAVPLGDVVTGTKNIQLITPVAEKVEAIRTLNNEYWVLTHGWGNNNFYAYKIDASGIQTTPVVTSIGSVHTGGASNINAVGYLKVSPQYNKIALIDRSTSSIDVFDFDFITGIVTNELKIYPQDPSIIYGLEFSRDGKYLYFASKTTIEQYNFATGTKSLVNIDEPGLLTPTDVAIRALQLGPDNKIYVSVLSLQYLSVIENSETDTPQLVVNAVYLNVDSAGRYCEYGLPSIFFDEPTLSGITLSKDCVNDSIILTASSTAQLEYHWSTGDIASSIMVPNSSATYYVTATYGEYTIVDSISISAFVANVSSLNNNSCNGICSGEIQLSISGGETPYAFNWLDGSTAEFIDSLCDGQYAVTVTDNLGCRTYIDSIVINSLPGGLISGIVQYSGGQLTQGEATVILYSSTNDNGMGHIQYASTLINENNMFIFENVPSDNYYIKVDLTDNQSYPSLMNSYYDSTHVWADASIIELGCDTSVSLVVNMFEFTQNGNGNGHVEGFVNGSSNNKSMLESLTDISVTLVSSSTNNVTAYTIIDNSGFYSFDNIPVGQYSILVDIPGITQFESYTIDITESDTTYNNINFIVETGSETTGIYLDTTLRSELQVFNNVKIYPNPANDYFILDVADVEGNYQIINMQGVIVKSSTFSKDPVKVNISDLSPGFYYINIDCGKGMASRCKIVKIN